MGLQWGLFPFYFQYTAGILISRQLLFKKKLIFFGIINIETQKNPEVILIKFKIVVT